ncbi:hypothetical protein SAMN04488032_103122 [Pacificibacter marinus]|uniref:Uncharacterized protein n=1 Tax=Pacificibacter marinus TaxID=658057 RepID=A0A1Y5SDH6_9RHOB|nr:hypothetical protein SAMN04488032_103122 [Pacificibacter marinus]SLN37890.1 hypothetical protein PAM7971_01675 [Pacificibacter marinus]
MAIKRPMPEEIVVKLREADFARSARRTFIQSWKCNPPKRS